MYTLNNTAKFLQDNQIKIIGFEESVDWEIEDDGIYLENGLALQIGDDYIGISHDNGDDTYTYFGYYKKGKSLAVMIHILLDRYAI
jgi:hypothetical protein